MVLGVGWRNLETPIYRNDHISRNPNPIGNGFWMVLDGFLLAMAVLHPPRSPPQSLDSHLAKSQYERGDATEDVSTHWGAFSFAACGACLDVPFEPEAFGTKPIHSIARRQLVNVTIPPRFLVALESSEFGQSNMIEPL